MLSSDFIVSPDELFSRWTLKAIVISCNKPGAPARAPRGLVHWLHCSLRDSCYPGSVVPDGSFVSCGTLDALPNAQGAGIRPAAQMDIEIRDPRRQRSIVHRYAVQSLPVVA